MEFENERYKNMKFLRTLNWDMPAMIAFKSSTMAQLYFDKQQTRERLAQIY